MPHKVNWATIVTLLAVAGSWMSIIALLRGDFYFSFSLALVAFLFDCLDGFVARHTHTESQQGRQLDSLTDCLIYLIYPALVYYHYFNLSNSLSVLVQSGFIGAGLYRLARFNDSGMVKSSLGPAYPGIPVVFSFLIILILIFIQQISAARFHLIANALIIFHTLAMVTTVPFSKPSTRLVILIVASILVIWIFYGRLLT